MTFHFPYKHNHTLSWSKDVSGACLPWVEHLEFSATQVKASLVGFVVAEWLAASPSGCRAEPDMKPPTNVSGQNRGLPNKIEAWPE